MQLGREVAHVNHRAHSCAFPSKNEVETFDVVNTCFLLALDRMANVLFALSSIYSYVL